MKSEAQVEARTKKGVLKIKNMCCVTCAAVIEKTLGNTRGVLGVEISWLLDRVCVQYDSSETSLEQIEAAIDRIGYKVFHPGETARNRLEA